MQTDVVELQNGLRGSARRYAELTDQALVSDPNVKMALATADALATTATMEAPARSRMSLRGSTT